MAKIKGRISGKVKRRGGAVKAGATMPRNIGGIANAKVVAIVKKKS